MPRFGFTEETIKQWEDQPIFLDGNNDTAIIIIHGWTSLPRQVETLAKVLNKRGFTIYVPLLKGHGTKPEDLENVKWEDWLEDVKNAILETRKKHPTKKLVLMGTSIGGNLALLASQSIKVNGVVVIGTPLRLRNHFLICLGMKLSPFLKKYLKKRYPIKVRKEKERLGFTSYPYFPVKSVNQVLAVIKRCYNTLKSVNAPVLILQVESDYLVSENSARIIFDNVSSKNKKIQWLKSNNNIHIIISEEMHEVFSSIEEFITNIENS